MTRYRSHNAWLVRPPVAFSAAVTLFTCSTIPSFSGCGTPNSADAKAQISWDKADHGTIALTQVQNFVERQLKAPGTAVWPGMFESLDHVAAAGNQRYLIRSWVDAENSFGAKLRNRFTAVVKEVTPDQWKLEYLKFDDSDVVFGRLDPDIVPNRNVENVVKSSGPDAPARAEESRQILQKAIEQAEKDEQQTKAAKLQQDAITAQQQREEAVRAEDAKYRLWTSENGKYSIDAKLVSLAGATATLRTRDGTIKKVSAEKLSTADQEFIKKWRSERQR